MERYKKTKYGYRYDKVIFYCVVFLLTVGFVVGLSMNGWELNKNYIHVKCDNVDGCSNPIKKLVCTNEMIWGEDCSIKCDKPWCELEHLPQGEYGEVEPRLVKHFGFIASVLIVIALLLNHLIHNKGVNVDLELCITKKIIFNFTDLFKKIEEDDEDDY